MPTNPSADNRPLSSGALSTKGSALALAFVALALLSLCTLSGRLSLSPTTAPGCGHRLVIQIGPRPYGAWPEVRVGASSSPRAGMTAAVRVACRAGLSAFEAGVTAFRIGLDSLLASVSGSRRDRLTPPSRLSSLRAGLVAFRAGASAVRAGVLALRSPFQRVQSGRAALQVGASVIEVGLAELHSRGPALERTGEFQACGDRASAPSAG